MGRSRYGGRRTALGLRLGVRSGLGLRRRRLVAGDQPLRVPEDDAGEALAEAGEERDDAIEGELVVRRGLRRQQPCRKYEVRGDAEDRADQRLVEAEPAQERPADLEVDAEAVVSAAHPSEHAD